MSETEAATLRRATEKGSSDYVRFIILSGPRTGSNMLAQALNSSPKITCFREVFNRVGDFIQFDVEGYDNFSAEAMSLRSRDPVRFLEERIFCSHPREVRAVGFKFHYQQLRRHPGPLHRLVEDRGLRVLHLRRQNLLRMLVSLKIAQGTGVYLTDTRRTVTLRKLLTATRHPSKAAARLRRRLRSLTPSGRVPRPRVTVSPEELFDFAVRTVTVAQKHDQFFGGHPKLAVSYEDMVDRGQEVFSEVQSFLGVEPEALTVTLRQQNPQPLRELIENYDELYGAFKNTPEAAFFD